MKLLLFDFDGTLADTLPICIASFQEAFLQVDGVEWSEEEIEDILGPPETEILRTYTKHGDPEEAVECFYETYASLHPKVTADPAILEMLSALREAGFFLGIITGKARRGLDYSLRQLNMEGVVDWTIAGDETERAKPDPECVDRALQQFRTSKEETMILGDTDADIGAGQNAGITACAVNWLPGFTPKPLTLTPDAVFRSPEELRFWLYRQENPLDG
ncbi:HAD family hydrolase [Alkalicoccus urumqiensis]|uniref:HAD family hydrolase n=1 Tax=Alkalicoccus urumqiensis TaxID=1548213 RepID=A0A2P6MIH6_ALKUR|nr:HAD family hydrolase [Alkalicoccus urumqiensis]PRO66067.1 HAD family hydrolase [Alkalicoccus urumqiensis]